MATERPGGAKRKRLSDERVAEMLDVARDVFLEKGYDAASTAGIAERANASKSTFYKRFPSKQDLFLAVIERHTEKIFEGFVELPRHGSVRKGLQSFGGDLLRVLLKPEQITLLRLVCTQAERHPELASHYFQCGPRRAELILQSYFEEMILRKRLRDSGAAMMARHFVSLISGSPIRWYVLGFDPTPISPQAAQQHLKSCVALFLRSESADT